MPAPRFDRHATIAFVVASLMLLTCGLAFRSAVKALNLYLRKEPVELRSPLSFIPRTLGKWAAVGEDRKLAAEMIEELGTDKYLDRNYAVDGQSRNDVLNVHLAYYTGMIDTVPHVPDRCMVAGGFTEKALARNLPLALDLSQWPEDPEGLVNFASEQTYRVAYIQNVMGLTESVRLPVGELRLRTVEFGSEQAPDVRIFGGYFFIANGRMTPSPEGVKALAFNLNEKYAYYCKVQYMYISRQATEEKFLELVADHLQHLLPELMRCLPDWSEVERRNQKEAASTK